MLRISKLTDYAIVILTDVSKQPEASASAKSIADRTALGLATVKKILRQLMQQQLLTSAQGVCGGYTLTKCAKEISVAEVITAMEGNLAITECSLDHHDCQQSANCELSHHWKQINTVIFNALNQLSIDDMTSNHSDWQPIHFAHYDKKATNA